MREKTTVIIPQKLWEAKSSQKSLRQINTVSALMVNLVAPSSVTMMSRAHSLKKKVL